METDFGKPKVIHDLDLNLSLFFVNFLIFIFVNGDVSA